MTQDRTLSSPTIRAHAEQDARRAGIDTDGYTDACRALQAEYGPQWLALPLLDQMAVLADFIGALAEETDPADPWDYFGRARRYRANIGADLNAYARCMRVNMRRAYTVASEG